MSELQQLIKQFKKMKASLEELSYLKQKRDDLDELLGGLHEEVQELLSSKERTKKCSYLQLQKIQSKQNLIVKFKKRKIEFDSLINKMNDVSDEKIENLCKSIVQVIQSQYPQKCNTYKQLNLILYRLKKLKTEFHSIIFILSKLSSHLDEISETLNNVKKKNVFSFLFKSNSNAIIAKHLQTLNQTLSDELLKIESIAANTEGEEELREIYAEIILFFNNLKTHSQSKSGNKKIDTVINKAQLKVNDLDRCVRAK